MAHRRLHGTEHQNGGADEIDVGGLSGVLADRQDADKLQGRDVQDVSPSDGDVLTWDSGDGRWEPAAPTGGGGTFGSGFYQTASEGISSTSGSTWVEKLSLSLSDLPSGLYRISWCYEYQTNNSSNEFLGRVQLDDTTNLSEIRCSVVPATGYKPCSGFCYQTLSGSKRIDIDFSSSKDKIVQIRRARIEVWRVS